MAARSGGNHGVVFPAKAREVSRRVRQAQADARAGDVAPILAELQAAGVQSLAGLARGLSARGIPTARGAAAWSSVQVSRVLTRLARSMTVLPFLLSM
jgi:hypothetical protein